MSVGAGSTSSAAPPLLEVDNLRVHFPVPDRGEVLRAVDGASFKIAEGNTLGLVGESGSGKTTTGQAVLGILPPSAGAVRFGGRDIAKLDRSGIDIFRREVQMIFQDPYGALNPRMRVGTIVAEPLVIHRIGTKTVRKAKVAELLELVGLDPSAANRLPHEFSGGQRQRIGIARALALQPRLIVCDEPVSALDVSIQAQIITLLERLQRELRLTYLFIAHDLAVVRRVSTHVAVMYLGKIVEYASRDHLYGSPRHPYTKALMGAVPGTNPTIETGRAAMSLIGEIPSPLAPPGGCHFHPRCPIAAARCKVEEPMPRDVGRGQLVRCHLA
jgi:oligopeptide transport system ATP-binding protein